MDFETSSRTLKKFQETMSGRNGETTATEGVPANDHPRRAAKNEELISIVRQRIMEMAENVGSDGTNKQAMLSDAKIEKLAKIVTMLLKNEDLANKAKEANEKDLSPVDERIKMVIRRLMSKRGGASPTRPAVPTTDASTAPAGVNAVMPTAIGMKKRKRRILLDRIGVKLFQEMHQVIKEIKEIRGTSMTWTHVVASPSSQVSGSLPKEISQIYFDTPLIEVEHHCLSSSARFIMTPDDEENSVNRYDWEALIQQAKDNLEAFRKLEREQVVRTEDSDAYGRKKCCHFFCG